MRPRAIRLFGLVIAVAVLLATAVAPAAARARTGADDAALKTLLGHASAMATILEEKLDAPKDALDALDAYKKKNGKKIRKALTRVFAIGHELDEPLRADWASALGTSPEAMRLIVAIFGFRSKHGDDATTTARFDAMLDDLKAELSKAEAAAAPKTK
jgi:hypothetical protein